MTNPDITLAALLSAGADNRPAIEADSRPTMYHIDLRALLDEVREHLNKLNVGRNDRVGIVLPNGPEMAAAFVAIGSCATTAPLNPGYRAEEFEFYLNDLNARALVVQAGDDTPAREVAEKLDLPVIELTPRADGPAGAFDLSHAEIAGSCEAGPAQPDDIALVLHTSGTTSRPKIVPLSHINVCISAHNIGDMLALTQHDRCLNIMPLFHIHGLIAAVLSSLSAGGSVWCSPGFNALRFFGWLQAAKPTWYTAVPTMHQAIAGRAERNPRGRSRRRAAPDPIVVVLPAAPGHGGSGGRIRVPGDRKLRHDGSGAPDGVEPAAARSAQTRLRWRCRRTRSSGGLTSRMSRFPQAKLVKSAFAAPTSPPAMRKIRAPTKKPLPQAGSTLATRDGSTTKAISISPGA